MNITSLEKTDSVMNDAMVLAAAGKMDVFDSVISETQTVGRGQYGRNWISPKGNIYAAMRLPTSEPFDATQASLVLSTLIAIQMRRIGFDIHIKWMNDLVIRDQKVGGVLLEKRHGILIAGIGINLLDHPPRDRLRRDAAIKATSLAAEYPDLSKLYSPLSLWREIADGIAGMTMKEISDIWHGVADDLLIWKGRSVWLGAGAKSVEGIIKGIAKDGALILKLPMQQKHFYQGSLWLV